MEHSKWRIYNIVIGIAILQYCNIVIGMEHSKWCIYYPINCCTSSYISSGYSLRWHLAWGLHYTFSFFFSSFPSPSFSSFPLTWYQPNLGPFFFLSSSSSRKIQPLPSLIILPPANPLPYPPPLMPAPTFIPPWIAHPIFAGGTSFRQSSTSMTIPPSSWILLLHLLSMMAR